MTGIEKIAAVVRTSDLKKILTSKGLKESRIARLLKKGKKPTGSLQPAAKDQSQLGYINLAEKYNLPRSSDERILSVFRPKNRPKATGLKEGIFKKRPFYDDIMKQPTEGAPYKPLNLEDAVAMVRRGHFL